MAFRSRTTSPTRCRARNRAWRAGRPRPRSSSPTAVRFLRARRCCSATSPTRSAQSPARGRLGSIAAPSPTSSLPPSSPGGVALVEMLNILEGYRLGEVDAATRVHLMVEAMKRAYFDRAKFLGDPASVTPPAYLKSKRFAESVRARIDPARAAAAASFGSIFAPAREGDNTTHFSVVDRFGNAVA